MTDTVYQITDPETHESASDHQMITFDVIIDDLPLNDSPQRVPCYNMADWETYERTLTSLLNGVQLPTVNEIHQTQQIDSMIQTLSDAMLTAQREAVPLVSRQKYEISLTPEIREKIQVRNRLSRRLHRNPGLHSTL